MKPKYLIPLYFLATALAHSEVEVTAPWVRATVPNQKASGAFMELKSKNACKLVSASSLVAKTVEIHEMVMEGEVMKMRQIKSLDLPGDTTVKLSPAGYHVMLIGLKEQLKEGQVVELKLTFEKPGGELETMDVKAVVRPLANTGRGEGTMKH
ncbi:copper chaperone PCu(A)C [Luteolibacter sp. Populi]|uniref:copper chaperone PCu(A)C n=1 Tax=Luteolibacter sp. Populi TaxID=3230487 RepID=UPI00346681AA